MKTTVPTMLGRNLTKLLLTVLITLFIFSCQTSNDEVVLEDTQSLEEGLSFSERYKNAPDKAQFIIENKDYYGKEIDEQLVKDFFNAKDKIAFIENNLERFGKSKKMMQIHLKANKNEFSTKSTQVPNYDTYTAWKEINNSTFDVFNDIAGPGINYKSPSFAKDRFASVIGSGSTKPHGVYVNDVAMVWTGSPQNPVDTYGWDAEYRFKINGISASTYDNLVNNTSYNSWTKIPGINIEMKPNGSSQARDLTSSGVSHSYSNFVEIQNSHTVSTTLGSEFEAGVIFAKGSASIEVSYAYTRAKTERNTETFTQNLSATAYNVPANGRAFFHPQTRSKTLSYTIEAPFELSGYVAADYGPGKWNGSHFWATGNRGYFQEAYDNSRDEFQIDEQVQTTVAMIPYREKLENGVYKPYEWIDTYYNDYYNLGY